LAKYRVIAPLWHNSNPSLERTGICPNVKFLDFFSEEYQSLKTTYSFFFVSATHRKLLRMVCFLLPLSNALSLPCQASQNM
jgi:hypothetical protein